MRDEPPLGGSPMSLLALKSTSGRVSYVVSSGSTGRERLLPEQREKQRNHVPCGQLTPERNKMSLQLTTPSYLPHIHDHHITLSPRGRKEEEKSSEGFSPPRRKDQGHGRTFPVPQQIPLATHLRYILEAHDQWLLMVSSYFASDRKEPPRRFCENGLRLGEAIEET